MRTIILIIVLLIITPQLLFSQNNIESNWKYFGQNPPGEKPEIFAPGIISGKGRIHCFPTFTSIVKKYTG